MNSEEQICQEALRLLRQLRTDYLTRACEGDEQFRARVEEKLRAFVERPAGEDPPEVTLEESGPLTEGAGSVIGHYRLLQPIGEGGFGVVYMA
jgi:eukaryotic-like serine/threonine-protein kinase